MQQDPRVMRRLSDLEAKIEELARTSQLNVVPPLAYDQTAGQGATLSLDQSLLDAQPADNSVVETYDEVVKIVTGVLTNGVYDAVIQPRVDGVFEDYYSPPESVWFVDLSDSSSLPAGKLVASIVVRDPNDNPVQEANGPYLVSTIPNNLGNALSASSDWTLALSLSPTVWAAGTYVYGSYVSDSGHDYLEIDPGGSANQPGVTTGAITGATNASPIGITSVGHGLSTGDYVAISGVVGNTSANGVWYIIVTGLNTFTLDGSAGDGSYASGGEWSLDWMQADVLNTPAGYSSGATYTYDPVLGADVVQEVRGLYAIQSEQPVPIILITAASFIIPAVNSPRSPCRSTHPRILQCGWSSTRPSSSRTARTSSTGT